MLSADAEHGGQLRGSREDGESRTLARIVQGHPSHASHLVGQPRAQLDDGAVGAPRHAHRADVLHHGVAHGVVHVDFVGAHPGIGEGGNDRVGDGGGIGRADAYRTIGCVLPLFGFFRVGDEVASAEVLRCSLVVASEKVHHLFGRHLLVGSYAERQVLYGVAKVSRRSQLVHDVELANAVVFRLVEIVAAAVGAPEGEVALAIPELQSFGHVEDILRCHIAVGIAQVELVDARDIGRDGYLVVGNAHGRPHAANLLRSFAEHFEYPHLLLVGDGQTFAAVAIAVALHQFAHQADGFAGCRAAFQGDACQLLDHEHALLVP